MPFRTVAIIYLAFTALSLNVSLAEADTADLQRKIQQQERHIESLKREIEDLSYQLNELQQRGTITTRQGVDDPLVGIWQCTNNVFTYDMTFFAEGRLLQETATFGNHRQSTWERVGDNEILLQNGIRLRASFNSEESMIVENVHATELTKWECQRKAQ